jgi:hypothetical protein
MKFLLSVIALCLVMITAKLYIPQAQAEVGGKDWQELGWDSDFTYAVKKLVENCEASGRAKEEGSYMYMDIDC